MSIRGHERWGDELAAYLLGGLEPGEVEAVERHLSECERCREELAWLRPAVEVLAESVPRREPPPALRDRLLAEVRADPSIQQRAAARPPAARRRFLRPAVALGALALVAAAAIGYTLGDDETDVSRVAGREGQITAALEVEGDSGMLVLKGMRALRRGRVYQAWVQEGARVEASSVFVARRDGTATAAIPRHLEGAERVMVTIEPRGGSQQPRGSAPILDLALSG